MCVATEGVLQNLAHFYVPSKEALVDTSRPFVGVQIFTRCGWQCRTTADKFLDEAPPSSLSDLQLVEEAVLYGLAAQLLVGGQKGAQGARRVLLQLYGQRGGKGTRGVYCTVFLVKRGSHMVSKPGHRTEGGEQRSRASVDPGYNRGHKDRVVSFCCSSSLLPLFQSGAVKIIRWAFRVAERIFKTLVYSKQ